MTPYNMCQQSIALLVENPLLGNDLTAFAQRFSLSPSHFQKVFKQYVGVSPKQFQQSLLVQLSKPKLISSSLLDCSEALSLSSPSRLHDAFVQIEAMSPGEFKSLGQQLTFYYGTQQSVFGLLDVICTDRGIHYLGFQTKQAPIKILQTKYPDARFTEKENDTLLGFDPFTENRPVSLHVSATNFQLQVWRALLNTHSSQLLSYKDIAIAIGNPKGARGVGQAVGANPVAFLIPCHRVIQQSGAISGYRWGAPNKQALLAWEQAILSSNIDS
ncbi:methylated-DNA--[protein]-cysteine S-methyltransferase [Oceaniserpentilla sp. 4NH20-0058]|uniref:bifunctional helix-turn-helix domain-containing protein/methylated-DNA--[protein]-cysteine S-methyltransferase n=1 Tax=Oceaniserpentilla sp. 4NH20-0058 TaxID=3127660 RepID=UPI00310B27B5